MKDVRLTQAKLLCLAASCIVSEVVIEPALNGNTPSVFELLVARSQRAKCDRCWRHVPDTGRNPDYPTVCLRCVEALDAIDFPPYTAGTEAIPVTGASSPRAGRR